MPIKYSEETKFLTAVCAFEGFGPARIKLLLNYFKSSQKIWEAPTGEFKNIGLKEELANKFDIFRKNFDIDKYFEKLKTLSIWVLSINDKNYPENLKDIDDAPVILYIRGTLIKGDSRAIAIVGSRMMTSYGREVANKFAAELSNFGITIISGLALGVDAEAQKSALNSGGRTISVLASGLNNITPYTNQKLGEEIVKSGGALISEYPLSHSPAPYDFPVRDRIIAGLAKGVIVIEARMKSGTFYTVKAALNIGRPVFAVPGQITSPSSEGTNYLIQNGAKLVTSTKEIMDELNLQTVVDREIVEKILPSDDFEAKIYKSLEIEPLHLDELVRISGSKTSNVSARLTIMEMKGMVKHIGNSVYRKI